jgi:ssRNA-specific RNase YbeY (16S rRNA maturation enzyme)
MDHVDSDEAEVMEERERQLLAKFHRSPEGPAGPRGHQQSP